MAFNSLLAEIVAIALRGTSFNSTDGSRSYSGMENRVVDPVHEARTELGHDPEFQGLVRRARELRRREAARRPEGGAGGALGARGEEVQGGAGQDPGDAEGDCPGVRVLRGGRVPRARYHQSPGGRELEGGMKRRVRNPFPRVDSIAGKSLLAVIRDSIFTIRCGRPRSSPAQVLGFFSFGRVVGG
jgi:hypothetical protein